MQDVGRLKRVLRLVFGTVALLFVAYSGYDLWQRWDGSRISVNLGYLSAAVVAAGAAMCVQVQAFRVLVETMSATLVNGPRFSRLYLDSQMARYTPGKVGLPIVRIAGAEAVGVSGRLMGSATLVELVSWAATGSVVGGFVLFFLPTSTGIAQQLSLGSLAVALGALTGLLVLVGVDRKHFPERLLTLAGNTSGPLVPWRLPGLHLVHFMGWMVSGALVCLSVGGSWGEALAAGGLLCLALVAGFVALLAPAGAGVREAVMAAGLAPLLGPSAGVAVGLLARVASLVSDVVLWVWFRWRVRPEPS